MTKPPELIPQQFIGHLIQTAPTPLLFILGGCILAYLLYRFVFRVFGQIAMVAALGLVGIAGYGIWKLQNAVASWQKSALHPTKTAAPVSKGPSNQIVDPLTTGSQGSQFNLNGMSPLAHENSWLIAVIIVIGLIWGLLYLIYRNMEPAKRAQLLDRMHSAPEPSLSLFKKRVDDSAEYPVISVEVGIRKDNGKPITIGGKDRFINTLVEGSTGTGKTSRVLKKAVFQDIRAMVEGAPMDAIVVDPDGDFAKSAVDMAEKFGIKTDVIDLTGKKLKSTMSFNPFKGGDIADIIDNVRAALQEKMGRQEGFFQNAQDDLVRTVIQVQVPLWPDADFAQFADLVTDPIHFRAVCNMINEYVNKRSSAVKGNAKGKKKKKDEVDDITNVWEQERPKIEVRFDAMSPTDQSMVLTAARSFLMDTRSEQKMEKLETVTKGLKIVVNELATNPRLQEVFRTDVLPTFDFKTFLNTGREEKGRLLVVITGNRPAGKLFGKLFLVTLKMYGLDRDGSEETRRPVYLYVDEFSVFGTESFTEMFSQARKYRVGMMLAIQARAQLLDVSKKFMDVVEGSCRNKIYFPAPSPDDAKFLEHSLGSVTNIRETHTENRLTWFWFDDRNLDRRISTQESVDPRFRQEDIAYGLKKDEAIFVMTVDNQAMAPCVGLTSYAEEWTVKKRGFYNTAVVAPETRDKLLFGKIKPQLTSKFSRNIADVKGRFGTAVTENAINVIERLKGNWNANSAIQGQETPTEKPFNRETATAVIAKGNGKAQPLYVKPGVDPQKVISIETLLRKEKPIQEETPSFVEEPTIEETAETVEPKKPEQTTLPLLTDMTIEPMSDPEPMEETKKDPTAEPTPATTSESDTAPQATRINLKKRSSSISSEAPSGTDEQAKLCPQCGTNHLMLTTDHRNWRCTTCGFERKNR